MLLTLEVGRVQATHSDTGMGFSANSVLMLQLQVTKDRNKSWHMMHHMVPWGTVVPWHHIVQRHLVLARIFVE